MLILWGFLFAFYLLTFYVPFSLQYLYQIIYIHSCPWPGLPPLLSALSSFSGIMYIKYTQYNEFNRKVQQLKQNNQLQRYLYNASEQSSYFIDQLMRNMQKSYNVSHIDRYKQTLLKFAQGKVLQTCAGSNRNLKYYAPGTNLTLLDWSAKMVSVGSTKTLPTIKYNYIVGDVTKMPFKDNQFDTVVDIFGLEHVLMPRKALSEIRRVCKKNGSILLMNQGLSGIVEFHYWQNFISGTNLIKNGIFTNRNWQKLVKQFDFQIEQHERKKNGKLYIYVLRNKKEKTSQQLNLLNVDNESSRQAQPRADSKI